MNTTIYHALITEYRARAFAHEYIFGFIARGTVYASFVNEEKLPYLCKLDRASRGAGYSLRCQPDTAQTMLLLSSDKVLPICSEEYLKAEFNACKYNYGEVFEKIVTEYYGQEWTKDHIPFDEGADITIEGIGYQIKFEKATFTNEKTLMHRGA